MKLSHRRAQFLLTLSLFALTTVTFAPFASAQDPGWQVRRADYGFGSTRTDVTNLVRNLISRGGVDGRITVNNQTMGGDPAPGRDKTLHIFARNGDNQDREFDYVEGGFIPAAMFMAPNDDWDARGPRDRDDRRDLTILRGFYGVQGRTANVTDLLQNMVRDGQLRVNVNGRTMGGDPAVGADKFLIVIYRRRGKEEATVVAEGNNLSIP